jgi:hypothetical protein
MFPDRCPSQYGPKTPETYMLSEAEEDTKDFQIKLDSGGAKYPWVMKASLINT